VQQQELHLAVARLGEIGGLDCGAIRDGLGGLILNFFKELAAKEVGLQLLHLC
jgi:hypothetical protein